MSYAPNKPRMPSISTKSPAGSSFAHVERTAIAVDIFAHPSWMRAIGPFVTRDRTNIAGRLQHRFRPTGRHSRHHVEEHLFDGGAQMSRKKRRRFRFLPEM
jgi:hypothetical protein